MRAEARRTRKLVVDGLVNSRDLGGLRRRDGSLTPFGVFYRSENVDRVTDSGWEQVREAGIRTVVDLRQAQERARDVSARPGWLTTIAFDLDGIENQEFWKNYWENGLHGTALYFLPHLDSMPERAATAIAAIVGAAPGGVLFHCKGGRDRTGMIAMLLLAAVDVEPEEIVNDYLETVRLGDLRAAATGTTNDEPEIDAFCNRRGTSTEGAFRDVLAGVRLHDILTPGRIEKAHLTALTTWRGAVPDSTT